MEREMIRYNEKSISVHPITSPVVLVLREDGLPFPEMPSTSGNPSTLSSHQIPQGTPASFQHACLQSTGK